MRWLAIVAALMLCARTFAPTILTWDTNSISPPVTIYTAEKIGEGSGDTFTLPRGIESGTLLICVGQGTFVTTTNTTTVTVTNYMTVTTTTTMTNWITATITNTVTKTNFVTKTNTVTITNVVGPGKPPKK